MKLSACLLVIVGSVVTGLPVPQVSDYEIVPAILVHEEHNGQGSEARAMNIPFDIYGIINQILEKEIPLIIGDTGVNGDSGANPGANPGNGLPPRQPEFPDAPGTEDENTSQQPDSANPPQESSSPKPETTTEAESPKPDNTTEAESSSPKPDNTTEMGNETTETTVAPES